MKTIRELQQIWKKEKEHYLGSEIGSGVQRFVFDLLTCPELFNLKEGYKSTTQEKRRNEFLKEEGNKAGQVDAVIFIDQDIVIPLEVEKFKKIKSGEWQIDKYRTAFDKKYGILTDGNEWRFYYGDVNDQKYFIFTLDEIFSDTKAFLIFWNEYIRPVNYYVSFFDNIGQHKLEHFEMQIMADKNRQRFFNDVTKIIKKLKTKLLNTGYFNEILDNTKKEKKATEISYSYLIQFILYKTLVDNDFDEFKDEFKKKEKLIHSHLKSGSFNAILMILEGMSVRISENIYKPFYKEQEIIIKQVKELLYSGKDDIMNMSPFLDIFIFIKQYQFANIQNDIFGAIYENYLKELFEEKNYGQYFTDPEVVDFMLREIGYTSDEIKKRNHKNISIIDPSCGSGTFLYSAVREIMQAGSYTTAIESKKIEEDVNQNIFGLDVDEFPLYLAEMSILMRLLPSVISEKYNNPIDKKLKLFMTEDSISEFIEDMGSRKANLYNEMQGRLALGWRYDGFMRDERDLDEMKQSLSTLGGGTNTIPRRRFDFVIGNPPYIGYNECSKLGVKIVKSIQNKESGIKMNDIYGWNLNTVPGRKKAYAPKPNLYAFFMALGFVLLKPHGRFAYIVPQTLLTSGDLDVVRYQLANEYTLEKIVTFAGNLFIGRGTNQKRKIPTSSLIIVCSKEKPKKSNQVECVHFPNIETDIENIFREIKINRSKYSKDISQQKLKEKIENWNFITWNSDFQDYFEKYLALDKLDIYRLPEISLKQFSDVFYFDKGLVFLKSKIRNDENGDFLLVQNSPSYNLQTSGHSIDKNNIRLPGGAQGFDVFQKKYKIVWRYINPDNFKFSDKNIMLDFNWILISSNNKQEMIYLFALLNSSLNLNILNALFKVQNEKSFLIGIKTIKEFVRIPKIDSAEKESKKESVIKLATRILELEKKSISDIVKINSLIQRFDSMNVQKDKLILTENDNKYLFPIEKGYERVVSDSIKNYHDKIGTPRKPISLMSIKEMPAIDSHTINALKNEIDELFMEMYELTQKEKKMFKF
ncbi:MAG TPA: DNA methyltransferase [Candidatus Paceibacterota bacterium]|nr:DNA methyltransferase [Candidatus Paceibacterota bacterium]